MQIAYTMDRYFWSTRRCPDTPNGCLRTCCGSVMAIDPPKTWYHCTVVCLYHEEAADSLVEFLNADNIHNGPIYYPLDSAYLTQMTIGPRHPKNMHVRVYNGNWLCQNLIGIDLFVFIYYGETNWYCCNCFWYSWPPQSTNIWHRLVQDTTKMSTSRYVLDP